MFNLLENGSVTSPAGFTAVAIPAGLKKDNQLDLSLVYSERDCACAAVFTTNQVVAAPVIV
ncbi:MAG: bifunctional ornithine acetyltransferase/N-acetylglutamate synthase, partial [Anaerolineae bacterium]|nr:bifunctional ornithine acetyltransferase/N-acetylglutamate synthase [Anaerolineae bacterium]